LGSLLFGGGECAARAAKPKIRATNGSAVNAAFDWRDTVRNAVLKIFQVRDFVANRFAIVRSGDFLPAAAPGVRL